MGGLDLTHCPRALRLPAGWRLNRSKLYPARDESGLEVLLRKTVGPLTGFSPKKLTLSGEVWCAILGRGRIEHICAKHV